MAQASTAKALIGAAHIPAKIAAADEARSVARLRLGSGSKVASFGRLRCRRAVGATSALRSLVVTASVAATEKPSAVPEIQLQPIKEISGVVKLPGSKSLSNRILLLAALAEGTTIVDNLLSSEDIHYMLGALRKLGIKLEEDNDSKRVIVHGCGGKFPVGTVSTDEVTLFLGNAGTAMRPLTAAVAAARGKARYILDGVPRMRERPIGDLVDGLKQLGVEVDCTLGTNCPPVSVNANGGLPGGKFFFGGQNFTTSLYRQVPFCT